MVWQNATILNPTGNSWRRNINQVCGPIVPDKPVKFRDSRSNLSREIPPEAVRGGIVDGFVQDNFRLEVISDVISGVVVDPTGVKVILGQTVLEIHEDTSNA